MQRKSLSHGFLQNKFRMTFFWLLCLLFLRCNSSGKFLHFPVTSGRSDTVLIPHSVVRPTGRPSLQTVESDQTEAAQALLRYAETSLLDRGSLNPRKRAKEASLATASDPDRVLQSGVNIGEYAEQSEKFRSAGSLGTLAQKTTGQGELRPRPRVKMSPTGGSETTSERSRGRLRLATPSPPPPKSRFTILRSGTTRGRESILVSNRENILARDEGSKKKITLLENSRRRNTSQSSVTY